MATCESRFRKYLLESGNNGIKGIEPPLRLALIPYLSGYIDYSKEMEHTSYNGGMDVNMESVTFT